MIDSHPTLLSVYVDMVAESTQGATGYMLASLKLAWRDFLNLLNECGPSLASVSSLSQCYMLPQSSKAERQVPFAN